MAPGAQVARQNAVLYPDQKTHTEIALARSAHFKTAGPWGQVAESTSVAATCTSSHARLGADGVASRSARLQMGPRFRV